MSALLAGASHTTLNPQNDASRVKGSLGKGCYLGPPARAGEAVTTPPSRPSSAPSAAITPDRLMAITPLRATARWPGAGHTSSRRTRRGGNNRPCPHYHLLGVNVNTPLPAGSEARGDMRASRLEGAPGAA
jgi:hypothetical protein